MQAGASDRRVGLAVDGGTPGMDGICHAAAGPCYGFEDRACRPNRAGMPLAADEKLAQARKVPSSSFSAHLMTSSSFSLPCVNFEIITVLIAWLYIWAPTSERAGAPNIEVCSSPRGG